MRPQIILYGKDGCGLCEEARADLDFLVGELDFDVTEIDIMTDNDLFERYRYLIPVVDIDGGDLLTPPLTMGRLRDAIATASARHG